MCLHIHSSQGLVRLCTAKYSPPTEKTRHKVTSHLTNYSLNKKSDGFVRGEEDDETGGEGSKRSLTSLLKVWCCLHWSHSLAVLFVMHFSDVAPALCRSIRSNQANRGWTISTSICSSGRSDNTVAFPHAQLLRDNGEDVEDLWSNLTTLIANTIAAMHGPLMEAWEALGSSGGNLFQVGLPCQGLQSPV